MKTKFLQRVLWLMIPLLALMSNPILAGEIRDVENIVFGNQYRIKTAMGGTYYLVVSNSSGGNGGITSTEADVIFYAVFADYAD